MPKAAQPSRGRNRKPHNLYLDPSLVEAAKGIARNSEFKSLSMLVESLLGKHIERSRSPRASS